MLRSSTRRVLQVPLPRLLMRYPPNRLNSTTAPPKLGTAVSPSSSAEGGTKGTETSGDKGTATDTAKKSDGHAGPSGDKRTHTDTNTAKKSESDGNAGTGKDKPEPQGTGKKTRSTKWKRAVGVSAVVGAITGVGVLYLTYKKDPIEEKFSYGESQFSIKNYGDPLESGVSPHVLDRAEDEKRIRAQLTRFLVIYGPSGGGKSTLVYRIMSQLEEEGTPVKMLSVRDLERVDLEFITGIPQATNNDLKQLVRRLKTKHNGRVPILVVEDMHALMQKNESNALALNGALLNLAINGELRVVYTSSEPTFPTLLREKASGMAARMHELEVGFPSEKEVSQLVQKATLPDSTPLLGHASSVRLLVDSLGGHIAGITDALISISSAKKRATAANGTKYDAAAENAIVQSAIAVLVNEAEKQIKSVVKDEALPLLRQLVQSAAPTPSPLPTTATTTPTTTTSLPTASASSTPVPAASHPTDVPPLPPLGRFQWPLTAETRAILFELDQKRVIRLLDYTTKTAVAECYSRPIVLGLRNYLGP